MTRNLKVLGLALCAMFALSAVAAQAASAVTHDFHSDSRRNVPDSPGQGRAKKATRCSKRQQASTKRVICSKVNVEGTIEGETVNTVTVRPIYEECGIYEEKKKTAPTQKQKTQKN